MIVVKGMSESLVCFLCLFPVRLPFFNVGEKNISQRYNVLTTKYFLSFTYGN